MEAKTLQQMRALAKHTLRKNISEIDLVRSILSYYYFLLFEPSEPKQARF